MAETIRDIILRLARQEGADDVSVPNSGHVSVESALPVLSAEDIAAIGAATNSDAAPGSIDQPTRYELDRPAPRPDFGKGELAESHPVSFGLQLASIGPMPPVAVVAAAAHEEIEGVGDRSGAPDPPRAVSSPGGTPVAPPDSGAQFQPFSRESVVEPGSSDETPHSRTTIAAPELQDSQPTWPDSLYASEPIRPGAGVGDVGDHRAPPVDGPSPTSSNAGMRPAVDSINEGSRQIEAGLHELENALSRLFQMQVEALHRLQDQAREHERLWIEQSTARRAEFSAS